MSIDKFARHCMCDVVSNDLIVDGDTDAVYHSVCSGLLGDVSDITIDRLPKPSKKAVKTSFELQSEISDYLFGSTGRNNA